jgi:tetratricopeptide (TPR) repeat protein
MKRRMARPIPERRKLGAARAKWLWTRAGLALALATALLGPARAAPPPDESTDEVTEQPAVLETSAEFDGFMASVEAWDFADAEQRRKALVDPRERELAGGVLAVYEARYVEAEGTLAALVASSTDERDAIVGRAAHYLDIARGAQLALGEAHTVRSDDGRFEAVFADERDAILAPYLFEAMAAAYDALGATVGVRPDHPIRFEFYDEPGKLALVTPLTLDNIYTTGTVGICKYRRIMMITPRVMIYGYGWLDTAVHEYVHYVLTIRTKNAAPVWMQEGLAKLLENRWRQAGRSELSPPVRKLLHDALERDQLVTLEQMHPSIAMLPTQELAALAYAEAETMLGLLEEQRGSEGLNTMLDDVAGGVDAKQAFADAWGDSFEAFFEVWKSTMRTRTAKGGDLSSRPGNRADSGSVSRLAFRDEDDTTQGDPSLHGDVFSHLGGGRARKHARLGVLLTLRGHLHAAVLEYEKAREVDPSTRDDPQLARRLGELYLELDRPADALPLLIIAGEHEPENANIAAAEARARRLNGDLEGASAALDRAVQQNPFIPGIHCDLAVIAEAQGNHAQAAAERGLCME